MFFCPADSNGPHILDLFSGSTFLSSVIWNTQLWKSTHPIVLKVKPWNHFQVSDDTPASFFFNSKCQIQEAKNNW